MNSFRNNGTMSCHDFVFFFPFLKMYNLVMDKVWQFFVLVVSRFSFLVFCLLNFPQNTTNFKELFTLLFIAGFTSLSGTRSEKKTSRDIIYIQSRYLSTDVNKYQIIILSRFSFYLNTPNCWPIGEFCNALCSTYLRSSMS